MERNLPSRGLREHDNRIFEQSHPPWSKGACSRGRMEMHRSIWSIVSAGLLIGSAIYGSAQEMSTPGETSYSVNVLKPAPLEATDENIASLKLPPGFHIAKFADGLDHPRVLLAAPNGMLYVSSRQ